MSSVPWGDEKGRADYYQGEYRRLLNENGVLTADLAAMTAERDAALRDLLYLMNYDEMDGCDVCKKFKGLGMCDSCVPEWRGMEDNTNESTTSPQP